MTSSLRIAVADDEPDMQKYFQTFLPRLGHEVVSVAGTGKQLIEQCRQQKPDLLITDIMMPELDGIEAATVVYRERPLPIVLVSAFHDQKLIDRAGRDHAMAYLVKPIKQADLEPAIGLAVRRFEQFVTLTREAADLRQALEDRKVVERAKGILMRRSNLDEQSAFTRLQNLSSAKNVRMAEVAKGIVLAEEAFEE